MKYSIVFIAIYLLSCFSIANAANAANGDDYMEGHPSYNQNYYSPSYNNSSSTPNYDSNYYDRTYDHNGSYQRQEDNTPYGNDIRDYNPYYDRDGNLK